MAPTPGLPVPVRGLWSVTQSTNNFLVRKTFQKLGNFFLLTLAAILFFHILLRTLFSPSLHRLLTFFRSTRINRQVKSDFASLAINEYWCAAALHYYTEVRLN